MKTPLAVAALVEMVTGTALIVVPSLVAHPLLGEEISGVAVDLGRLTGIGLLSLGIACWPLGEAKEAAFRGMAVYGGLAAAYLGFLGIRGDRVGLLLWPAVALHVALTLLLVRERLRPGEPSAEG